MNEHVITHMHNCRPSLIIPINVNFAECNRIIYYYPTWCISGELPQYSVWFWLLKEFGIQLNYLQKILTVCNKFCIFASMNSSLKRCSVVELLNGVHLTAWKGNPIGYFNGTKRFLLYVAGIEQYQLILIG